MNQPHPSLAATHEVLNQAPPLENWNLYESNHALQEGLEREGAGAAAEWMRARGAELGSPQMLEWAAQANRNPPSLRLFDAAGHRRDEVEFHPAYHELMAYLKRHGASAGPWSDPVPGAHVKRAAFYMLYAEVEDGTLCPTTMTYAVVPAIARDPALASEWLPRIYSHDYDRRFVPAAGKKGVTLGMGMTERQGGTDVRANITTAKGHGEHAEITGHKWFMSAPMCDAFLVLAQAPGGLSCFLLPRWRPDGTKNPLQVLRLKRKMGNVSNASSETELRGALAWMVGEEGRGVRTIIEMVAMTRFDCMIGSSSVQRAALAQALHHCSLRSAFGRVLNQQPLMRNVLADMALEVEASVTLTLRMGRAMDSRATDPHEDAVARLVTAVGKYWICKRTPQIACEAMECMGGSGVMEDSPFPRHYREAPVNAIWEGSGNVQCLDVLRAMQKSPAVVPAFLAELAKARGGHALFDRHVDAFQRDFLAPGAQEDLEYRARDMVDRMAVAVQAALLIQHAPAAVSDAFCASRLGAQGHHQIGALPAGLDLGAVLARAQPAV